MNPDSIKNLKKAIKNRERTLCMWITFSNQATSEIMAKLGCD